MAKKQNRSNGSRMGAVAARTTLLYLVVVALACAALSALFEVTLLSLMAEDRAAAAVVSMVVSIVLFVALIVFEVRSYRAVVACTPDVETSDRVLLAAALWFGGALPQCVVSVVRHLSGIVVQADPTVLFAQLGLSIVLVILAALRFFPELRRR